jgi:nitrogen fixation protein NifB
MRDLSKHPCFNGEARHQYGRIHLPVAPRCNMQCNFCNRKYDCVNEGHPGVTSAMLTPSQALDYLTDAVRRRPEIAVAGFAGPGDPFANPRETMQTLRLVRQAFPSMLLCVATNGLAIGPYIEELAELEVSHVTLTINAVDPEVGARIYSWMRDGKRIMRGAPAAELLWDRQREAVKKLKEHGITVKINSILIPGINEHHMPEVAETAAALGADLFNCMPMVPVEGSEFENLPVSDGPMIEHVRSLSRIFLPQMMHCARCRADAVGLISEAASPSYPELRQWKDAQDLAHEESRPFVAVASYEGVLVNQHLGEAEQFRIYQRQPESVNEFEFREFRMAPAKGAGEDRWHSLAALLHDCRAILVASAGPQPQSILKEKGFRIVEMEGLIEEGVTAVYANQQIPEVMQRRFTSCRQGKGCSGTGAGCG